MKLLRSSWCPFPQAKLNVEVTERMRLSPGKDENLGNLNVIHKLILPHREESEGTTESRVEPPKKMEPGACLDLATEDGGQFCDGRSCVRFQWEDLSTWFGGVTQKEKTRCR